MSPEFETRIYHKVLRSVLWDTKREEIFHMLEVNGITGEAAEEMFCRARSERISLLRSDGVRKALKGALMLAAGATLFWMFWSGLGAITRGVLVICGLLALWGAWWLLDGILNAILAPTKKGSVTPDA
jgi:hypothetical protein